MIKKLKQLLTLGSILISVFIFTSCKNWEYNVVKNGIFFEKIHQSKGGTYVGYMKESQIIQGFPCEKGWIHFRDNWQLLSFQLSEDFEYKSTLLPAHSWVLFPYHKHRTGHVISFPYDVEVQGYVCGGSGGYKGTHTGFYEDGSLRSFYPPDDVMVDGVLCDSTLLVNVNLYENGRLKSCELAKNIELNGKTYKSGSTIEFTPEGLVK